MLICTGVFKNYDAFQELVPSRRSGLLLKYTTFTPNVVALGCVMFDMVLDLQEKVEIEK